MSVNVGADGRRSVQVEVEVSGTPEEVWQAIATGPGISSWFVPTTLEERVGGTMKADFGMGMESESTITEWNPPHSFKKDGDGMSPEAPPVATEWIVEARSGGKCVVRVVHSWFASTDEWDGQWEAVEQGWNAFFSILRLWLEYFPGQLGSAFDVAGMSSADEAGTWDLLTAPFGLSNASEGMVARSGADVPALSGKVEIVAHGDEFTITLITNEPGTGVCHFSAMPMGGKFYVSVRFYLFGADSVDIVAKAGPDWSRWFAERFPMGD